MSELRKIRRGEDSFDKNELESLCSCRRSPLTLETEFYLFELQIKSLNYFICWIS